ncbi:hypothetical protein sce3404 [Sorangium cellulosum So ce56]|uniref:Uncharacterized protein n=1 Tax=Sorangium cellulosum (strain So ce56) TaxID=448385 RepID=A9GNC4_SORC5|nr:hypothetical protein sce3404 [Sorangium cellulosum So ce56]
MGMALTDAGEHAEAIATYERAIAIREKVAAPDPVLASSLTNMASLLDDMGDYPRALAAHERALGLTKRPPSVTRSARGRSGPRARRRADAPLPPAARASRDRSRRRGGRRARGSALCLRRLRTRAAPHVVAPQWLRGLSPSSPSALAYDKPLCAALDGFTLHAATRAGAR